MNQILTTVIEESHGRAARMGCIDFKESLRIPVEKS